MSDLKTISGLLSSLDITELRQLNEDVVSHIRHRQRFEQSKAMRQFRVGDLAEFYSEKLRKIVRVRIDKFNQKSVTATQMNPADNMPMMTTWRVAPSLLKSVA